MFEETTAASHALAQGAGELVSPVSAFTDTSTRSKRSAA
jgi:hypothetical protein